MSMACLALHRLWRCLQGGAKAFTIMAWRGLRCRCSVLLLGAVLGLLGLAAPAQAATYTFRSDTYLWESAANAITWDKTCTSYANDDDKATISFTGGLTFKFAGTNYASVQVLTNGGLAFVDSGFHRSFGNTSLPAGTPVAGASGCARAAPSALLLAYWADLDPGHAGSGGVSWEQKGTAPNRYVVVSWNAVYESASGIE